MTKRRTPGTLHDALRADYEEFGIERVALLWGRSVKWLIMSSDPDCTDRRPTFEEIAKLAVASHGRATKTLEFLAACNGYSLTPIAARETRPADVLSANANVLKEVSETALAVSVALGDGHVSEAEKRGLIQHYREVEEASRAARLSLGA